MLFAFTVSMSLLKVSLYPILESNEPLAQPVGFFPEQIGKAGDYKVIAIIDRPI